MIQLILMATMMTQTPAPATAQFQPCVWPNRCATRTVAQFQPCVWPNRCATEAAVPVQPCVWPNTCG
ncbi:MAG: hypothetical protein A2V88_09055 [Elusimicrobia bacterium RBG_16_66_12]|nr:MAG: hypothetical protein A2V88_09055 [Elusimicrobia bacterium RBG_16_66_12]